MLPYCQLDPKEHILVKFHSKFNSFNLGNAPENVFCEMAAILSLPQCINCEVDDVFPHDDLYFGSDTYTNFIVLYNLYLDV